MEVWSIDGNSETFVEGAVLTGKAGVLTLPKSPSAYFEFTTASTTPETIRIKFLPCKMGSNQAFTKVQNAAVASLVGAQKTAVDTAVSSLAPCPFTDSISTTSANSTLFSSALFVSPDFSSASGLYTALLPTGSNKNSLIIDIALARQ